MPKEKLVRCEQRRHNCVMCQDGCCNALNNTEFKKEDGTTYKCPFYKTIKDILWNYTNSKKLNIQSLWN